MGVGRRAIHANGGVSVGTTPAAEIDAVDIDAMDNELGGPSQPRALILQIVVSVPGFVQLLVQLRLL